MIDLHTHTTASDGTYTPEDLVALAHELGISHLAITDHDSVQAIAPAREACKKLGITLIPAIELSVRYRDRPMDILGYGIQPDHPRLTEALATQIERRNRRIPLMLKRLEERGLNLTEADVREAAQGQVIGRPHIARALVDKGVVDSIAEAFEKYLGRGRSGYVPKEVLAPIDAIQLIKKTGGLAVLAHPTYLRFDGDEFEVMLGELIEAGLEGIEVYYSQHTQEEVEAYEQAAKRHGLLATGGSDFHGANKPHIRLGIGPMGQPLHEELALNLLDRVAS